MQISCKHIGKENILENLNDELNLISFVITLNKERGGFIFLSLRVFTECSLWQFKDTCMFFWEVWIIGPFTITQFMREKIESDLQRKEGQMEFSPKMIPCWRLLQWNYD